MIVAIIKGTGPASTGRSGLIIAMATEEIGAMIEGNVITVDSEELFEAIAEAGDSGSINIGVIHADTREEITEMIKKSAKGFEVETKEWEERHE